MELAVWLDRFFDSYYRNRPVNATFIGVHDYDDRLPDFSRNGVTDVVGEMWTLLEDLGQVDVGGLTAAQELDRKLAEGYLRVQLWEFGSGHFQAGNPSVYTSEAVFGPMSLLLREGTPLASRLDAAYGRFERIPEFFEQARQNIRDAPLGWIEKAIDECQGGIALATDGVPAYLALRGVEHPELDQAAQRAARAFSEYRDYLQTEMLPRASDAYECGPDALDLCIRSGHFLSMTAQEIAEHGRATLEDCRVRLEQGAAQFGTADWREALAVLADTHPSASEYESAYQETWDEAKAYAEQAGLVTWPDYPIRYVPRYAWARSASPHLYFLFYRAPSAFDDVEVVDYLIEPLPEDGTDADIEAVLRAHNSNAIKLNHVVHHGGIGHHVQNWHAYRAESRIGRIAAVDCASRIAMLCGGTMAEGWSCYTTDLMDEAGFCTPLESLSQIHGRMRMGARAVADVGLHTGRMSLDEVIAMYRDEAGMSQQAARNEALKNSMNPGAALMYLIGTDQIHSLRRQLVEQDAVMDLGSFHNRFLTHGSAPVSLISEMMIAESSTTA